MNWKDFEHTHHRPHLLIVSMEAKEKAKPSLAEADFQRLAVTLRAAGNYAIKTEGTAIYVAFEDYADANRFAAVLRPLETTRDSEGIKGLGPHGSCRLPESRSLTQKRPPDSQEARTNIAIGLCRSVVGASRLLGDNGGTPVLACVLTVCT